MGVYHRLHVRPCLVNPAVNEPLMIKRATVIAHWGAIEIEFDDMIFHDHFGRDRGCEQEPIWIAGMTHAHMAIGVDYILAGQDAVGDHKVAHQCRKFGHEGPWAMVDEMMGGSPH